MCVTNDRPRTTGTEVFLHLYQNDVDNKEHLAIVFGPEIRSRSLNEPRPGETEMDRMIRGAYVGRLYPGRTSSQLNSSSTTTTTTTTTEDTAHPPESSAAKDSSSAPLVRIHSECYTGETAWSARCDCGEQLDEAARLMSLPSSNGGVIIYLRQEGRGIGLGEKLKAYNLQDLGSDTVEANLLLRHPADARSYGLATAILVDLGLGGEGGIRLLTNNPDKIHAVEGPNREVVVRERVPMIPVAWKTGGKRGVQGEEIGAYLRTKVSLGSVTHPTIYNPHLISVYQPPVSRSPFSPSSELLPQQQTTANIYLLQLSKTTDTENGPSPLIGGHVQSANVDIPPSLSISQILQILFLDTLHSSGWSHIIDRIPRQWNSKTKII